MTTSEAVVFFNPQLAAEFDYRCKQAGQLASKMRFHGAQWVGLLQDGAWLRHGAHANRMTQKLAAALRQMPSVKILVQPEVNAVFAELPPTAAEGLKKRGWYFYSFIGAHGYRLMCSWDTRDEDIDGFVADLRAVLAS
jgi:threonine aldolase